MSRRDLVRRGRELALDQAIFGRRLTVTFFNGVRNEPVSN
jgi:hypothetical protein